MTSKKDRNRARILGVAVDSASKDQVLAEIKKRLKKGQKTIVFTPNPEFLVYAHQNPWFKKALNQADLAVADGIGLVWAARFLGQPLKERVSGSDLTKSLLGMAQEGGWSVGVVGARGGVEEERRILLTRLQKAYPQVKFFSLKDTVGWSKKEFELVLACQGMGKQEKWLLKNKDKLNGLVLMGVGGSLDFLTGFARRAPVFRQKLGLEWLWRGLWRPAHFRRVWRAVFEFGWLVLKSRLKRKT